MPSSLPGNIALLWGILVLVNVPAPWLGIAFDDEPPALRFQPPGWVIPLVWFVLFLLLAIARWRLRALGVPAADDAAALIVWLAVLCATYAYYTLGLAPLIGVSPLTLGLLGNGATIACALWVAWRCLPVLPLASALVLPVAVWTSYATAIVVGLMRLGR